MSLQTKLRFAFWMILGLVAVGAVAIDCVGCRKKPADSTADSSKSVTLLNVSYDPTRELYEDINAAFIANYKAKTGVDVLIKQSHGGSGKQAQAIIDGLEADVATLGLAYDIDALHDHGDLVPADWQPRLPNDSTPYTSTIVFLVRKGNPKNIHDWNDLIRPDVQIIVPNPKSSGGARWAYLAAWGQALRAPGGSESAARDYITKFYHNVPVLDSGARGSTVTFAKRNVGDVLVSWENEAYLSLKEFGADNFEIVYPPQSILAEPPVTVVDKYVDKHGTREVAEAYLKFLYSDAAQDIIAKNHYRPGVPDAAKRHASEFPSIKLFTIGDVAGDWTTAQKTHFADGGVFDQIYKGSSGH